MYGQKQPQFMGTFGQLWNHRFLNQTGEATFWASFGKNLLLFIPTSGHTVVRAKVVHDLFMLPSRNKVDWFVKGSKLISLFT